MTSLSVYYKEEKTQAGSFFMGSGPGQKGFSCSGDCRKKKSAAVFRLVQNITLGLLMTLLWDQSAHAAQSARITSMTVNSTRESVLLFFEVENAFNDKLISAVNSGINISFSFPINIYRTRHLWKDKKVAHLDLTNTIKYDTLKKEYLITRPWKSPDTLRVNSLDEAITLMTCIDGLSLAPVKGLVKGETYRVKAKARMNKVARPKYLKFVLFFLNSWKLETRWKAVSFIY